MKKLLVALFSLVLLFSGIPSPAQSRIAIPSYQDPGSAQWNAWQALGSSSVGIMIVNLNNGDDTTYYPSVDQAIRNTRKKGIFASATCTPAMDSAIRPSFAGKWTQYSETTSSTESSSTRVPADCVAVNSSRGLKLPLLSGPG